jgi:hypothetical protein
VLLPSPALGVVFFLTSEVRLTLFNVPTLFFQLFNFFSLGSDVFALSYMKENIFLLQVDKNLFGREVMQGYLFIPLIGKLKNLKRQVSENGNYFAV